MMADQILEIRRLLKWKVFEIYAPPRAMEIVSDPWQRSHTIYLPQPDDDWRDIEYLHELAHSYLAETVHPLLGTAYFAKGTPQKWIDRFEWPKRTAADWFADDLLIRWCPDEEREEIAEHVELMANAKSFTDQFLKFGAGLMFAQAVQYRVAHPPVPREVAPVVEILRGIRPNNPSLRNMRRLINRLATLTTAHQLIVVSEPNNFDVWGIDDN
ncbi:MAG: hypothetical protein HKP58_08785 [Desulfatitalea sp.]|nr:hypothetical protein [Desulfatitalea sp.]NNK00494.1 hypothetical protein [Desulfatitalea sp.]